MKWSFGSLFQSVTKTDAKCRDNTRIYGKFLWSGMLRARLQPASGRASASAAAGVRRGAMVDTLGVGRLQEKPVATGSRWGLETR